MKIQHLLRSRAALALALVADLLLYAGSQGPFDYSQASFAAALSLLGITFARPIVAVLAPGFLSDAALVAAGKAPVDACLEACKRIARMTKIPRLLTDSGRPNFNVNFYAVDKKGNTGGASIYPSRFAFIDENGPQRARTAHLFESRNG